MNSPDGVPEFAAMWRDNDVAAPMAKAPNICAIADAGLIGLEYSAFAVDGRPDLGMVIYNPATPADAERIRSLIRSQPKASR